MTTLADLLRAAGSGLYGSAGGFLPDTGVNLANLARAAYGYGGNKLGLLAPQDMPDLIDPANVPGTTANVSGLLGVGNSVPEQVAQFAGGLLAPGGKKAPAKLDMTVYHGTPHTVDKFDMSKIGTGEGAQAYGHGLYFADNPATAGYYKDVLSAGLPSKLDGGGVSASIPSWLASKVQSDGLDSAISEWTARAAEQRAAMKTSPQPWIAEGNATRIEQELAAMQQMKAAGGAKVTKPGNLYKVDIPDDAVANMLHWDKPLSQQAPSVQAALGASDKEAGLVNTMPDMTGQQLYNELSLAMGGRDKASQFLNAQGIPGIRYLDAGSRGVGDGTYNTVLFNDQLANILGRE